MIVNVAFAIIKITAGVFGNAYALIADGIESALDVAGSIVIWGGLRFAARPPDATHPYGHGKAEPLTAIFVALGVLAAAVLLAVQSTRTIFLPHRAPSPFTLAVLLTVVVVKETWRHRADVLTSVAAFIGISIALIGGEKWRGADNWAAIFVCLVIATIGVRLLGPALHDILDTAPRGVIIDSVRNAAAAVPGVIDVEKCLIRKMGLDFYVDLHVTVNGSISVREGHHIAHEVKRAIQQTDARIADVLVHIEPAKAVI